MKLIKTLITLTTIAVFSSSCSMTGGAMKSSQHGYFEMRGDAEGIRAYGTYQDRILTNGKLQGDQLKASPAWKNAETQERTKADFWKYKYKKEQEQTMFEN